MSANLEHHNDRLLVLRVGSELLAFTGGGLRKGPVKFLPETGESEARAWLAE